MDLSISMTLVAALGLLAYTVGQRRALASAAGQLSTLHSLPSYYGWYAALWCVLPGLLLAVLWLIAAPRLLDEVTLSGLKDLAGAEVLFGEDGSRRALFLNEVRNAAEGGIVTNPDDPMLIAAADRYRGAASIAGRIALESRIT